MSFAAFEAEVAKINDLLCGANLLIWDLRTMMPPTGSQARGKQLGTLVGLARDFATGDDAHARLKAAGASVVVTNTIPGAAAFLDIHPLFAELIKPQLPERT